MPSVIAALPVAFFIVLHVSISFLVTVLNRHYFSFQSRIDRRSEQHERNSCFSGLSNAEPRRSGTKTSHLSSLASAIATESAVEAPFGIDLIQHSVNESMGYEIILYLSVHSGLIYTFI